MPTGKPTLSNSFATNTQPRIGGFMKVSSRKDKWSELETLVARRRGVLVHHPGTTCITVNLPNGDFMATGNDTSMNYNISSCIAFVERCRIGTIAPYLRTGPSNLGQIVSAAIALRKQYEIGEEMSAMVDGGEFGNVWVTYDQDMERLLATFGTTREELNDAVHARCRLGYALYSYLHI
jgi:hypothetical protein